MKEKITSIKSPVMIILAIAAVLILGYAVVRTFLPKESAETPKATMFGSAITTSFGTLTLVNKDNVTTLDGSLARSTPCVNWTVTSSTDSAGKIAIAIADANKKQVCVETTATPQVINQAITGGTANSIYSVKIEATTVFEGTLQPAIIPTAPTDGKAE